MKRCTVLVLLVLMLLAPSSAVAEKGLFLRLGLGPGVTVGSTSPNVAPALAGKDHAIGYGFTETLAVQVTDFGALVRRKVGEYDYMNLDGFGLGCTVFLPRGTLVSASAGYGQVTFAGNWWEPTGANKDVGLAVNASLKREWFFTRRVALAVGAQASFFRTFGERYTLFNLSLVGSMAFYLTPN